MKLCFADSIVGKTQNRGEAKLVFLAKTGVRLGDGEDGQKRETNGYLCRSFVSSLAFLADRRPKNLCSAQSEHRFFECGWHSVFNGNALSNKRQNGQQP